MARVSTHLLDELVREAEVLSAIKADIPNSWKILEHEIGRARAAAAVRRVDPLSTSSADLPSLSLPPRSDALAAGPSLPVSSSSIAPSSAPPPTSSSSSAPISSAALHASAAMPTSHASALLASATPSVPLSPAAPHVPASCAALPTSIHTGPPTSGPFTSGPLSSPRPLAPTSLTAPSTPLASATSAAVTAAAAAAAAAVADGTTAPARLPATAVSSGGVGVSASSSSSTSARHAVRKRVKLRVPAEQYPDYNFVGRLLGPRGATLKRLERDTGCRIMIRGKGSIRKDKEAEVRGKPGWEHVFHEPLHVVIEVVDAADDNTAARTLARAKDLVEMLLVPVPEERDSLKRAQLRDLAILNGTHRSVTDLLGSALHPFSLTPTPARSPPPPSPPPQQPPPLRRAMSQQHTKPVSAGLYQPSEPFAPLFDPAAPFARQSSQQMFSSPAPAHSRVGPPVGANGGAAGGALSGPSNNPSASADSLLPGLEKLRIPALEFDGLNEPGLSSPFPMPTPSPTIVDPEIYPYPPTPGLVSMDHQQSLGAFASPTWNSRSTSTNPSASLPPRSPPVPSNPSPSPSAFLLGRASTDGALTRNQPPHAPGPQQQQPPTQQHQHYQQQHQQHSAHALFQRDSKSSFGTTASSNNLPRDLSESSFSNHLSSFATEEELPSLSEFAAGGPASSLSRLPSPPPAALTLALPTRQATPSPPPLPLSPAPGSAPRSPFAPMPQSAKDSVPLSTLFPHVSTTPLAHGHSPELTLRFQPPVSAPTVSQPPPLSHPHRQLDHGATGAHASSNAS